SVVVSEREIDEGILEPLTSAERDRRGRPEPESPACIGAEDDGRNDRRSETDSVATPPTVRECAADPARPEIEKGSPLDSRDTDDAEREGDSDAPEHREAPFLVQERDT